MGNKTSLGSVNPYDLQTLPRKGLITKCRVTNIYDGDTITIIYLIGKRTPFKINLRLDGIDAPEISSKNETEKTAGIVVMKWLSAKISKQKYWWVVPKKWDKYGGRVVGTIYYTKDGGKVSINAEMLDKGLVVPYVGGKKQMWRSDNLESIIDAADVFETSSE